METWVISVATDVTDGGGGRTRTFAPVVSLRGGGYEVGRKERNDYGGGLTDRGRYEAWVEPGEFCPKAGMRATHEDGKEFDVVEVFHQSNLAKLTLRELEADNP
jgi:hypothetical protein